MMQIYTSKNCKYCKDLQLKLDELKIEYEKLDIHDDVNKINTEKVFEFVGEPVIPIIIIKPHLLAPKRSFNTIDEAITLIQSLIEE
jgi:glutaredoxin